MKYYSGKYWPEFDLTVILKPWKERADSKKSQSQAVSYTDVSVYDDDDNFSDSCESSHSSVSQLSQSFSGSYFLPPYPGSVGDSKTGKPVYSHNKIQLETQQKRKPDHKTADSHKGRYNKEYTNQLSGLKIDVEEKEIFELVKPFGDLTSRVRIASYPESGVCYAYANYYSIQAALNAVSQLDESEFCGQRIHVCHRGGLGVEHSCKKELQALAERSSDSAILCSGNTTASAEDIKEIWGYDDSDVVIVQSPNAKVKAKIPSYASVVSDSPKLTKATSKSPKGPERKSKPKRQPKPPTKQPTSSYGKSGFRGLQPYPSIEVDVLQAPQFDKASLHDQDVIKSLLHAETVIEGPPHDQSMIATLPHDENVIDVLPGNQFVTILPQSDENFIKISTHDVNVTPPYNENLSQNFQNVIMAPPCDLIVSEPPTLHNVIKVSYQDDVIVNCLECDQHLPPPLDQVSTPDSVASGDVDPNCMSLQISNLHPDTSVQDLEKYLKPYGSLAAPISIRYHGDSDSCSAVVRYDSVDVSVSVMEKLDGSDFNGYQMCVVRGDGKTSRPKVASNIGVIQKDESLIGDQMFVKQTDNTGTQKIKTPSPAKKTNNTLSSTQ